MEAFDHRSGSGSHDLSERPYVIPTTPEDHEEADGEAAHESEHASQQEFDKEPPADSDDPEDAADEKTAIRMPFLHHVHAHS